jgi:hypothetical protein
MRKLWLDLVRRANGAPNGFESLSEAEQLYFAVGLLQGEVCNGGFDQYFFNGSGDHYTYAVKGLEAMGAFQVLDLLKRAKQIVFGFEEPESDTGRRRAFLQRSVDESRSKRLSALDVLFWKDPDCLPEKVEQFAKDRSLVGVA